MNGPSPYISLSEAGVVSGYTAEYLRQLCVKGKLKGHKIGKSWVTTLAAIEEFKSAEAPKPVADLTLSLAEAAKASGYTSEYLRQLCIKGKIEGRKLGKSWVTSLESINKFKGVQVTLAPTISEVVGTSVSYPKKQRYAGLVIALVLLIPILANLVKLTNGLNSIKDKTNQIVSNTGNTVNNSIQDFVRNKMAQILGQPAPAHNESVAGASTDNSVSKGEVKGVTTTNVSPTQLLSAIQNFFSSPISSDLKNQLIGPPGPAGLPGQPGQVGPQGPIGATSQYIPNSGSTFSVTAPTASSQQGGTIGSASYFSSKDLATQTLNVSSSAIISGNITNTPLAGIGNRCVYATADGILQAETVDCGTGAGTAGGTDTQVQFNDGGTFGGDAGLTYNKTSNVLSVDTIQLTNTGLKVADTNASNYLNIIPGSDLTADRNLNIITGDSDRTLTLLGNPTLDDWFNQSVKTTASPTFVAATLTSLGGGGTKCLQTDNTGLISVAGGACGTTTSDSISVNSVAATDANFLDVSASGSVAGTSWTLDTVANPDNISVNISNASNTVAGVVTTGVQTFAGNKTFNGTVAFGSTTTFQANDIVDAEVSDTLTASIFKGTGTTTDAVDLATAEVAGTLPVGNGGTGVTSFTSNGVLYGNASGNVLVTAQGASGTVLHGNGGVPSFSAVVLGTDTSGNYVSDLTGTANQITVSAATGSVTLSLPSDLRAPGTFNAVTSIATGAGAGTVRIDASGNLTNIGTISSGLINGQTISSAANFTGTLAFATLGTTNTNTILCQNASSQLAGCTALSDSQISDTLTSSIFHGSGSTTDAVDLATTEVAGILTSSNGGTGNGFTKFTGPTTSEKTFTLPDVSTTICTTNSVCSGYQPAGSYLTVESDTLATVTARGATTSTASSFTGGATIRNLTVDTATATDDLLKFQVTTGGAARFSGIITSADLTGSDKTYTFPNATGTVITTGNISDITGLTDSQISDTLTSSIFHGSGSTTDAVDLGTAEVAGTLGAGNGGTGINTYAVGDIIYASGSTTLSKLADVATGNVLISGGVTTAPSWGKVVLGTHTTGNYVSDLTGTANQITVSAATGSVTLSLPSDLRAPGTFNAVTSIATGAGAGTVRIDSAGVGTFANNTVVGTDTFTANTITDSGALTIASTTSTLTLDSGNNILTIAAGDTTIQRIAAGTYTLDLKDGSDTIFAITNSGAGNAKLQIDSLVSAGTQCVQVSSTGVISGTGSGCGSSSGISSITLAGTSGSSQTITDGDTILIAAGLGTTTTGSATDTVTVALDESTALSGSPALAANTEVFGVNGIVFEGTSADAFETFISVTDPTADQTITIPDRSGTVSLSGDTFSTDVTGTLNSSGTTALTIAANAVSNGKFRQSAGLSVVGNSTNSTGNVADITGTADQVLKVNSAGNALGFGTVTNAGLANSSVTINTSGPLGGGGAVSLGGSLTLTCTTCVTSTYSFTAAGTSGTPQAITNGDTLTIAAGLGLTTTAGATDTVTVALDESQALSGSPALGADQEVFGASGLVFEGSTADTIETFIAVADPTGSDKTITFPNATGTVITTGNISDITGLTDSQISDTLTSSIFHGSGSTTDAVDLATAEVSGILTQNKGGTGIDTSAATDGQILIGKTSDHSLNLGTIAGTTNQITVTNGAGTIALSLPSDLRAPGTLNAVTSIATGAGAGTVRIDASGNLTNIGNITGTGAVTLASTTSTLTLDSGNNILTIAAGDTTLQRTAAGTYTIDLVDGSDTTLALTNSGAGKANLTTDGTITVGTFASSSSTAVCSNAGVLATCSGITDAQISDTLTASVLTANYVANANTSALTGLAGGSAGSNAASLSLSLDESAALSGDIALTADREVLGVNGIVFEGHTADTIETYLAVTDPTSSDHTFTFPDVASGNVCISNVACIATSGTATSVPFSGVTAATNTNALVVGTGGSLSTSGTGTITATALTANYVANAATGLGLTGGSAGSNAASLTLALDESQALSGSPALSANTEEFGVNGIVFEGSAADTFETFISVTNPSADNTITIPDRSGTVSLSGDTFTTDVTGTLNSSGATALTIATSAVTSAKILDGTIVNADLAAGTFSSITGTGTLTAGATGAGFTIDFGTSTVSGILTSANGGTGNGFTKFTGPTTAEKTFTLPDVSTTICTTNSVCSGYQPAGSYLTVESDTLATVTGRGATTATASSFTGGATIRNLTVDTATATDDLLKLQVTTGGAARFSGIITSADLTGSDKTYTFPNATGTVITTGNITDITGLTDSQISDTLTASIFKGSGTTTDAVDLATAEVAGVLPVANGGTNNSSAYTAGSVIYSDGTKLTQDNANLFYDSSNKRVGVGTATPTTALEVVGDITSKGTSWTSRTSSNNSSWESVAYGNGMYVAVSDGTEGVGNEVMSSPDGVNWTSRTAAANNSWNSVTYGHGLFVAVAYSGSGNRVMTSPDGINWTIRTSAGNDNWNSITYGNGTFVAVSSTAGTGNEVMTSPDGITWTMQTSSVSRIWTSVTYGNGLFVAVAASGSGNRVMTSPDGITWTSQTSAADDSWSGVTYGNGLFVAVANDFSGSNPDDVMTSPDGVNWTTQTAAAFISWSGVTYGNGTFVAVGQNGTNRVMTSPNGINWTSRSAAASNQWMTVVYGNGEFVSISNTGSGNRAMTSGKNEYIPFEANNVYQGGMNIFGNLALTTAVTTGTGATAGFSDINNYLTTGNGVDISSNSLTTGNLVALNSTSTAAGSNTQTVFNIATSGANGTSTQTTYGAQFANTHTGTSSTNIAAYFTASGGTNNYAAIFNAGNIGIGTTSPVDTLSVGTSINASATHALLNLSNTALSSGSSNGTYIGLNPGSFTGDLIDLQVANTKEFKVDASGTITANSLSGGGTVCLQTDNNGVIAKAAGACGSGGGMSIGGAITSATAGSVLYADGSGNLAQNNANFYFDPTNHQLGLGINSSLLSILNVQGTTTASGTSAIAGTYSNLTLTNSTSSGFQYGNRNLVTVNGSVAGTEVGTFIRMTDNTSLSNTVRGLEVQAFSGSNTTGVNTGIATFGKTFGIQATTTGEAGGVSSPAAVFADLDNSADGTVGNAIRAFSNDATSANLVYVTQDTSTFTGTGLLMNLANGSGTFSGNFADFQNNGTSKFTVDSKGQLTVAVADADNSNSILINTAETTASQDEFELKSATTNNGQSSGTVKAHFQADGALFVSLTGTQNTVALCHANNGQSNNDQIVDCSGAPSDMAEWYDTTPDVGLGDVVSVSSQSVAFPYASGIGHVTDPVTGNGYDEVPLPGQNMNAAVLQKASADQTVLGIVSTAPYQTLGEDIKASALHPQRIALSGRVPVKVSEENGQIHAGDRLTLSKQLPGYAAKMVGGGQSIGIALADSHGGTEGLDRILVFINLSYQNMDISSNAAGDKILFHKDTDFGGFGMTNVKSIASLSGKWSISEDGTITAEKIQTKQLCLDDVCINKDQLKALLQNSSSTGTVSGTAITPTDTTAPTSTDTTVTTPTDTTTSTTSTTPTDTSSVPSTTPTDTTVSPTPVPTPTPVVDPTPAPASDPTPSPSS